MLWSIIYLLVMIGVWLAVVATTFREGLWSLILLTCNMLFATIMALNYFEPLASLLVSMWRDLYWFAPGISFWILLATFMGIGRLATDALSRVKLKFHIPIELIGRILLCLGLATNTVYTVQAGFFHSNLPVAVFANQGESFLLSDYLRESGYSWYRTPVYYSAYTFSRMPVDERSAAILKLPTKYLIWRIEYAKRDGMTPR
jgi:hypothetical protein